MSGEGTKTQVSEHISLALTDVLRHDDSVVARRVAGETVLVPVRSNVGDLDHVFTIPVVGTFVWEKLDGARTLSSIVEDVWAEFDVERDVAEGDVLEFARDLVIAGLARKVVTTR